MKKSSGYPQNRKLPHTQHNILTSSIHLYSFWWRSSQEVKKALWAWLLDIGGIRELEDCLASLFTSDIMKDGSEQWLPQGTWIWRVESKSEEHFRRHGPHCRTSLPGTSSKMRLRSWELWSISYGKVYPKDSAIIFLHKEMPSALKIEWVTAWDDNYTTFMCSFPPGRAFPIPSVPNHL